MSSDRLRLGILGAARVAPHALVEPARRTPGIDVTAVASRSASKARAFAAAHGIPRAMDSYAQLIEDAAIDAVSIMLPPALHAYWTRRALDAGKHVLCEKPLTVNAASAGALIDDACARGLVLQEGMHLLFSRTLRRQRRLVASGELGRVRSMESCFRFATPAFQPGDFRTRFELGGGATLDLGGYAAACLRYVSGEEPTVIATQHRLSSPDVDSWMQARVALPSGAEGLLECGFESESTRFDVKVTCERGSIEWCDGGLLCRRNGRIVREPIPAGWTYQLQLDAFVRRIRGEVSDAPRADDAIATARVIDAIYAAAGLAQRQCLDAGLAALNGPEPDVDVNAGAAHGVEVA